MRQRGPDHDDLDLPPLDGEGDDDEQGSGAHEDDLDESATRDTPDALDDRTGEDDAPDEPLDEADEAAWNEEEETKPVDVGVFDVSLGEEIPAIQVLGDDEGDPNHPVDDELGGDENDSSGDGGEEGPLADDEELREEDLPELDADEDGDVDDASLYEGASIGIGPDEELRWADRAWTRVGQTRLPSAPELVEPDADDSGMLAVPGDDPKLAARDAAWRRLEEAGDLTAAAFLPGDSVVLALAGEDRPQLVRIQPDGTARIIAEIELPSEDDDAPASRVTALRWDAARGSLVATGPFGAQAFRPT